MSRQLEDTRIKILKCVAEHQPISAADIGNMTGINLRSVHYHIRRMKLYVNREIIGKYSLSEYGEEIINKINGGEHIEWILAPGSLPKEVTGLMLLEAEDNSLFEPDLLPGQKLTTYRSLYDIIVIIMLLGKKGFGIGGAVQKTGVSYTRITKLLRVLEEKRLISIIGTTSARGGKFWKTTEKGLVFLYLYSQIQGLLK